MKVTQCKGEGQGSCKRCSNNGKWNRIWMSQLYKIEGYDGCYCSDCVQKIRQTRDRFEGLAVTALNLGLIDDKRR